MREGERVRYAGRVTAVDDDGQPLMAAGMVGTIVQTKVSVKSVKGKLVHRHRVEFPRFQAPVRESDLRPT